MYNKIAPIILNLNKTPGASAVFISQPNSEKEKLAGKSFLLAEIGGRKSESEKIIKFLTNELEKNYYDDKLFLIGKINGLKLENIFEAAIGKINQNLEKFLNENKIKLNAIATSITIGAIFENKLHFSSFGKNRSLLIYRRQDGYEIINVENHATNEPEKEREKGKEANTKKPDLFSSVINGEIPLGSYFIFASESLPEYLSGREMVEIITKLPPIVASEQIKNVLTKINSYIPFLGIIIKNTTDSSGKEINENLDQVISVQNSISTLNHTEQKTENMLAPAGLVNWTKAAKSIKSLFKRLKSRNNKVSRKIALKEAVRDSINNTATISNPNKKEMINIFNLPKANSFLRQNKVSLKKSSHYFFKNTKKLLVSLPRIFTPSFWKDLTKNSLLWLKALNKKNIILFSGLILIALVLVISLTMTRINKDKQQELENFQALLQQINEKEGLIDSNLLYNNEDGAIRVLNDAKNLANSLPREKDFQITAYNEIMDKLTLLEEKTLKISKIQELNQAFDVTDLSLDNLVFVADKIYGAQSDTVYVFDVVSKEKIEIKISGAINLSAPKYDGDNTIYYRDSEKIFRLDTKTSKFTSANLSDVLTTEDQANFGIYNQRVYLLSPLDNKLFAYPYNLNSRSNWFKEDANIAEAVDLFIDGSIYILNKDSSLKKYYQGKLQSFNNLALNPSTYSAQKLLGDDKQLYILDPSNKRLAIVSKDDGHLISQYIFTSLTDIKDFSLDTNNKKVYILADNKIYEFSF